MSSFAPVYDDKAVCVVFMADNAYAQYLAVTICSIVQNSSLDNNYDLIVFDGGISVENQRKMGSMIDGTPNFSLRFFDTVGFLKDFDKSIFYVNRKFVIATYYRFFIAGILSGYETCLYLDCDLIVNGDVAMLCRTELNGHMVAAVRDLGVSGLVKNNHKKLSHYVYETLQMGDADSYFNAGVLVMNLARMRQEQVGEKLIEKLKDIKTPLHLDQSIMNALFNGDVEFLNFTYNFMWSFGGEEKSSFPPAMQDAYDHPQIIHYTTTLKPWNCKSKRLAGYFWKYAEQTPFREVIETVYQQFLINNRTENTKKYQMYKWMSVIALGLNKRLKQKRDDYYERLSIR